MRGFILNISKAKNEDIIVTVLSENSIGAPFWQKTLEIYFGLTSNMLHNLTTTVQTLQQMLSVTNFIQQGHNIGNSGNQTSAGNLQQQEDNNLTFEIPQVNPENCCANIQQNSAVIPASATSFRTETAIGGLNMGQCMENLCN